MHMLVFFICFYIFLCIIRKILEKQRLENIRKDRARRDQLLQEAMEARYKAQVETQARAQALKEARAREAMEARKEAQASREAAQAEKQSQKEARARLDYEYYLPISNQLQKDLKNAENARNIAAAAKIRKELYNIDIKLLKAASLAPVSTIDPIINNFVSEGRKNN